MSKSISATNLGGLELAHRVVPAPLIRKRTRTNAVRRDLMVEYDAQRASKVGLLIGEATNPAPNSRLTYLVVQPDELDLACPQLIAPQVLGNVGDATNNQNPAEAPLIRKTLSRHSREMPT